MRESLNPTLASRVSQALRPDWARTVLTRRIVAGGLVVLAVIAASRPDPSGQRADVVVAAHDLSPGTALTADDLRLEERLRTTVPDGSLAVVDSAVGATLAGPARRGEVLTDVRLLGGRLAEVAVGPDARIVPIHLSDAALVDLVRPGDVVDILAVPDADAGARVVAVDAVVVLVSNQQRDATRDADRVLLVALPARAANAVAGAALAQAVTLTLH